mgnify:CR=1 FL=1
MNRFDVLLTSCAMFACPAILSAQSASLEICNKGPVQIRVAYAARIQLFLTGYRWETSGWYPVDPGDCKVVYDQATPFLPADQSTYLSEGVVKAPDAKPLPNAKFMIHHFVYLAPGRVEDSPNSAEKFLAHHAHAMLDLRHSVAAFRDQKPMLMPPSAMKLLRVILPSTVLASSFTAQPFSMKSLPSATRRLAPSATRPVVLR